MNRYVKLGLWTAVATMLALAVAAIGWRTQVEGLEGVTLPHRPLAPVILLAVPLVMGVILRISARNLDARIPGISEDNTRYVEASMVFLFLLVVLCQAWMGFLYVGGALPGGETLLRGLGVLMGVGMAVRGNFMGKLSRPGVKDPPDPAAWHRLARRMGLTLLLTGVALTACAITLPLRSLLAVYLVAWLVPVGLTVIQRRTLARP
jgi:hypothetical protein